MTKKESVIVAKENKREFRVVVPAECGADKIHVDTTDYETGAKRCDYAIRVTPSRKQFFYYIELKGNDVIKAAKQLAATIQNRRADYNGYEHKEAWVIGGGWRPAANTQFQVQQRVVEKFGFKLQYKTNMCEIFLVGKVG